MANVNSINQISMCHGLGGLYSSIQYACINNKPHNTDNGQIRQRSLAIRGINCSDNPKLAYQAMKATLNKAYCTPISITGIRAITTYKGLNYHNRYDRKLALNMTNQLIHTVYGNRCQAIISLQADNTKHILHTHSIICARNYDNLKSITGRARWKPTVKASNEILQMHGFRPIQPSKNHKSYSISRYQLSFIKYIINQLNNAKSKSNNLNEFNQYLSNNSIQFEPYKMTKINGVRRIKLYSHPTKDGNYKRLSSGYYARYKRHFSYKFKFNGKYIIIRDKRLGYKYSPKSLFKIFDNKYKHNTITNTHNNYLHYIPHFSPIVFHNNRPTFPPLKVLGGHSLIYWLRHNAKTETQKEQKLLAESYYNNSDNQIKNIIKTGILDNTIEIIKLEHAIKSQIRLNFIKQWYKNNGYNLK